MTSNHNASLSDDLKAFLSDPAIKTKLLNGTLNLSSYATTIDTELQTLEKDCIAIYRDNSDTIHELSQSLEDCDLILRSLQEMLLGFSADLGGLSSDIKALQTESQSLGCQLSNRKQAVDFFREYLGRGILSPTLCQVICNGTINDTFVQCVAEVERKYRYLNGESDYTFGKLPHDIPSGKELLEQVTTLRLKAILRIRNYFLQSMTYLRKPKTNIRMIQVHCLLKYTPLLEFVLDANIEVYNEIRNAYVESMNKTLVALFRTYAAQLSLLEDPLSTSRDVIAVDEASLKDVWSRVNMSKRGDAFNLGNRWGILQSYMERTTGTFSSSISVDESVHFIDTSKPIQAHLAIASNQKYPYEAIFKSVIMHLMDSVTNDYVFNRQFFQEHGIDLFHSIFDKTLNLISEQIENHLFHSYDCIGLLLMIKLIHMQKRTMRLRKVDCLDDFFDSLEHLLWPRLKLAWDKHMKSIKDGDAKKLGMTNTELANTSAHYVSRRYAEFTCSILLILNKVRNTFSMNWNIVYHPFLVRLTHIIHTHLAKF